MKFCEVQLPFNADDARFLEAHTFQVQGVIMVDNIEQRAHLLASAVRVIEMDAEGDRIGTAARIVLGALRECQRLQESVAYAERDACIAACKSLLDVNEKWRANAIPQSEDKEWAEGYGRGVHSCIVAMQGRNTTDEHNTPT